jgi:uncharacterized protein YbbK (DUF523 family)
MSFKAMPSTKDFTPVRERQPKVGISACLTGQQVRYDGGNRYHQLIQQELAPWLNLQSTCPEVEAGLGIPRPPVQLVKKSEIILALGVEDDTLNVTKGLVDTSKHLSGSHCKGLSAYIVKARSPSCGAGSTPIHDIDKHQIKLGDGLFVQALKTAHPHILIMDESSFSDIQVCREFVVRCYNLQGYQLHQKTSCN